MSLIVDIVPAFRKVSTKPGQAHDGYSAHFGFTDTVHEEARKRIEREGVACVYCPPSFAGIHTANAKAFNILKQRAEQRGEIDYRPPGLVIYEGTFALVDLESPEQYRIFVRHVIPSEMLWGGMMTLFTELAISDDAWALLAGYSTLVRSMVSQPNG